jgi:DNA-directed RNA polymerase subunit RPC12/RpoP
VKCLRCGKEYDNPIPKVTNLEGEITEIMTKDWCARCNAIGTSVLFRERCAYQVLPLASTKGIHGFDGMPKI